MLDAAICPDTACVLEEPPGGLSVSDFSREMLRASLAFSSAADRDVGDGNKKEYEAVIAEESFHCDRLIAIQDLVSRYPAKTTKEAIAQLIVAQIAAGYFNNDLDEDDRKEFHERLERLLASILRVLCWETGVTPRDFVNDDWHVNRFKESFPGVSWDMRQVDPDTELLAVYQAFMAAKTECDRFDEGDGVPDDYCNSITMRLNAAVRELTPMQPKTPAGLRAKLCVAHWAATAYPHSHYPAGEKLVAAALADAIGNDHPTQWAGSLAL